MSNYLLLNPKSLDPESVAGWAVVLSRFPAVEVRAALATCAHAFPTQIQLDLVLRVLADRLWRDLQLPPPADLAITEIWEAIWDSRKWGRWSHAAVGAVAKRYGWQDLTQGDVGTASVRKAQVRGMYEAERERHVSRWIAEVSLFAERSMAPMLEGRS